MSPSTQPLLSAAEHARLCRLAPLAALPDSVGAALLQQARHAAYQPGPLPRQSGFALLLAGELLSAERAEPLPLGSLIDLETDKWHAGDALVLALLDPLAVRLACLDHATPLAALAPLQSLLQQLDHLSQALRESQVFGDLEPGLRRELAAAMQLQVVRGGTTLFQAGEPSDSLLVVVSGRLSASRTLADGERQRLTEIGPGGSVGEVGLVLHQPRAADVTALRDSTVASLSHAQFEQLLTHHPVALNRAIARIIFEYSKQGLARPRRASAETLTLLPLHADIDIAQLAEQLSRALGRFGRVHQLSPEEGRALHRREGASATTSRHLSALEHSYDYLIYQAEASATPWTRLAVRQADQLLLVADAHHLPVLQPLEQALADEPALAMVRKRLALLHPADAEQPHVDPRWGKGRGVEQIHPLRQGHAEDHARLARLLSGNGVGVVLGGGGARGFAHVGVLRALHEAGIPVDMVGGNSMGALLGAQYTLGTPLEQLIENTQRFVRGGERPTLPLFSLLSGQRVRRDLQRMFGDTRIEALWQPFFTVACNLSRADIMLLDHGPLWQAVLASNSPAGLLPPVIHEGNLLVDAALLDNVPVTSMRQKLGYGTLIAIDVDVRDELSVDPAIDQLTGWQVLRQRLFHRDQPRLPGIVDLLNRSGHLGGLSRREASMRQADHYLQPPVADFPLMAYGRGTEIAEAGYRYAQEQIAGWPERPGC